CINGTLKACDSAKLVNEFQTGDEILIFLPVYTTPLQGLSKYTETVYKLGCDNVACIWTSNLVKEAALAASQADATMISVGVDKLIEGDDYRNI
ncbi:hypothetical protein KI387_015412, partial [Taxus chinensis]